MWTYISSHRLSRPSPGLTTGLHSYLPLGHWSNLILDGQDLKTTQAFLLLDLTITWSQEDCQTESTEWPRSMHTKCQPHSTSPICPNRHWGKSHSSLGPQFSHPCRCISTYSPLFSSLGIVSVHDPRKAGKEIAHPKGQEWLSASSQLCLWHPAPPPLPTLKYKAATDGTVEWRCRDHEAGRVSTRGSNLIRARLEIISPQII